MPISRHKICGDRFKNPPQSPFAKGGRLEGLRTCLRAPHRQASRNDKEWYFRSKRNIPKIFPSGHADHKEGFEAPQQKHYKAIKRTSSPYSIIRNQAKQGVVVRHE